MAKEELVIESIVKDIKKLIKKWKRNKEKNVRETERVALQNEIWISLAGLCRTMKKKEVKHASMEKQKRRRKLFVKTMKKITKMWREIEKDVKEKIVTRKKERQMGMACLLEQVKAMEREEQKEQLNDIIEIAINLTRYENRKEVEGHHIIMELYQKHELVFMEAGKKEKTMKKILEYLLGYIEKKNPRQIEKEIWVIISIYSWVYHNSMDRTLWKEINVMVMQVIPRIKEKTQKDYLLKTIENVIRKGVNQLTKESIPLLVAMYEKEVGMEQNRDIVQCFISILERETVYLEEEHLDILMKISVIDKQQLKLFVELMHKRFLGMQNTPLLIKGLTWTKGIICKTQSKMVMIQALKLLSLIIQHEVLASDPLLKETMYDVIKTVAQFEAFEELITNSCQTIFWIGFKTLIKTNETFIDTYMGILDHLNILDGTTMEPRLFFEHVLFEKKPMIRFLSKQLSPSLIYFLFLIREEVHQGAVSTIQSFPVHWLRYHYIDMLKCFPDHWENVIILIKSLDIIELDTLIEKYISIENLEQQRPPWTQHLELGDFQLYSLYTIIVQLKTSEETMLTSFYQLYEKEPVFSLCLLTSREVIPSKMTLPTLFRLLPTSYQPRLIEWLTLHAKKFRNTGTEQWCLTIKEMFASVQQIYDISTEMATLYCYTMDHQKECYTWLPKVTSSLFRSLYNMKLHDTSVPHLVMLFHSKYYLLLSVQRIIQTFRAITDPSKLVILLEMIKERLIIEKFHIHSNFPIELLMRLGGILYELLCTNAYCSVKSKVLECFIVTLNSKFESWFLPHLLQTTTPISLLTGSNTKYVYPLILYLYLVFCRPDNYLPPISLVNWLVHEKGALFAMFRRITNNQTPGLAFMVEYLHHVVNTYPEKGIQTWTQAPSFHQSPERVFGKERCESTWNQCFIFREKPYVLYHDPVLLSSYHMPMFGTMRDENKN